MERLCRFGRLESRLDKGFANVDLQSVGAKQITAAHNVGDAHVEVVHGDGQLVGVDAVRAAHDDVADVVGEVVLLGAEYFVVEGDGGVGGGDAHRVAVVVGEALFRTLRFAGDEASACSWVHGETIAFLWCRGGADVGARAEAGVDERCCLRGGCFVACCSAAGLGIVETSTDNIADFVKAQLAEKLKRFLI